MQKHVDGERSYEPDSDNVVSLKDWKNTIVTLNKASVVLVLSHLVVVHPLCIAPHHN